MKLSLLIIGSVLAVIILFGVVPTVVTHNSAINREEQINVAKSNISKEEQRRVDLFNNLVDAIKSYDKYESSTLEKITQARSQANKGNVEKATVTINAVVEQYPQLKSQDNYKTTMREFSITENRLASYRENYNDQVQSYNRYVRTFPASLYLGMSGYVKQNFQYLDFHVDNSKATNLFDK